MSPMTHVSVPMTIEEREALRALANAELRDPREQARYLLRQALGLACEEVQPQPMQNGGATESENQRATVAA